MERIDADYSDQVERVDPAIVQAARANRNLVAYGRAAFQLATEFTDEGNRRLKAELSISRNNGDRLWEGVTRALPEYGEQIGATSHVLQEAYALCEGAIAEAAAASTAPEVVKAAVRLKAECDPEINRAATKIAETVDFLIKESKHRSGELTKQTDQAIRFATLSMVCGLAAILGLSILIARKGIVQPLQALGEVVAKFGQKDFEHTVPGLERKDEVGQLAQSIEVMRSEALKMEVERWLKSHTAEIGAALQVAHDLRALAQTAVSMIAPVMRAGHGAFYVLESDGRYSLLASYGFRERKHLNNSFAVGEGLVGQCAMEKSSIMLTAPKDYIRINSGLGEGPPASIIVQPIIHGERVLAVLEIASFQPFSERENAVLASLHTVLATTMEILDRNLRTKELLAATQLQSERMEKQAAQLEEQTVEMEAQQAQLLETESWFRSIIETAPDGMLVVDLTGQIMVANPMAARLLGFDCAEMLGMDFGKLFAALDLAASQPYQLSAVSVRCKDAGSVSLDVTVNPLPDRGGRGKCQSLAMRKHIASAGGAP
jgi:PAS domain S-box-containing protein